MVKQISRVKSRLYGSIRQAITKILTPKHTGTGEWLRKLLCDGCNRGMLLVSDIILERLVASAGGRCQCQREERMLFPIKQRSQKQGRGKKMAATGNTMASVAASRAISFVQLSRIQQQSRPRIRLIRGGSDTAPAADQAMKNRENKMKI